MKLVGFLKLKERFNKIFQSARMLKSKKEFKLSYYLKKKDGAICGKITEARTAPGEWIERFKASGKIISPHVECIVSELLPIKEAGELNIVIFKGMLFSKKDRTVGTISALCTDNEIIAPKPTLGLLVAEKIKPGDFKRFNLDWIVIMSQPIKDSEGRESLLKIHLRKRRIGLRSKIEITLLPYNKGVIHEQRGGFLFNLKNV